MIALVLLCLVGNVAVGMPSAGLDPKNVITVPPNCVGGQEWVNGACRDVWFKAVAIFLQNLKLDFKNTVTAPANCAWPQQWLNGACRDVWRHVAVPTRTVGVQNVVTVPPNCPPGQEYVNGACRDVWRSFAGGVNVVEEPAYPVRNIIDVPNQCPVGYKLDALGNCRKIFP